MPTETETARLAAAVNLLRPDWPAASIATVIRTHQGHRTLHDIAVALTWVATDPASQTPARVNEQGPWWSALTGGTNRSHGAPQTDRCRVCGWHHHPDEGHYRRQPAWEASF